MKSTQSNIVVARRLNSFTSCLSNVDQVAVAEFVSNYFCCDDLVDDDEGNAK